MKKKIYAVRKGRIPGIYDTWGETEQQVKGFSGAEYRSFSYTTQTDEEDEGASLSNARTQAQNYLAEIQKEAENSENQRPTEQTEEIPQDSFWDDDWLTEEEEEKEAETASMQDVIMQASSSMQDIVMQTSAISMELKSQVFGQDDVIDKFENAYFHTEKMINAETKRKGPRSAYLFAGPPGVGKTFIAEIIAHMLGIPYKRFDMSGYADPNTTAELMGISSLYRDSKPGVLTEFVREHPRCVLLFDEVEKACKEVILLFLQILDEGKCFDRYHDRDIDFRDTMVILTTNAGRQLYQNARDENLTLLPDTVIIDALKKDRAPGSNKPFFPLEIISRMSSHTILMFNHLRADAILEIIEKDLAKQLELSKKKYGYDIKSGTKALAATVLYSMGGSMDARNATELAGKLIDKELYAFLSLTEEKLGLDWRTSIRKITWEHDFSETDDEIRQFYFGESDCVIAIFGQVPKVYAEILTKNNVQIKATTDSEEFLQIIHKETVILAVIDYEYGMRGKKSNLSIADIRTEGGKLFSDIKKDCGEIPVYILHSDKGYAYSRREKDSLCRRGARGFIRREAIKAEILKAYADICCQKSMETLSLRHQRLIYDTRHELDEEQKTGKIVFHNFRLESAIDAEDKESLLSVDMRPDKHWDDIFVSDDVKKELVYFINFLKKPKEYIKKGGRIPRGVLMLGEPGTGKTSLAKVVAAESGVRFLEMSADVLMTKGSDEVHRVFHIARKYAPAVLFLDEVDAIGQNRMNTTANATLNALLTEMDGFKKVDDKPIFVMAATNIEKARLDPALVRRFDRPFYIDLPDANGRKWMLERLIKKHGNLFRVSAEEINNLAERSTGKSFADIENMIETALREAIRADKQVNDTLLDETFEKCNYGEARKVRSLDVITRTACHEAGHALIQLFYKRTPNYMGIVARGAFNGHVQGGLPEDCTKDTLLQEICELLGGRAAEIVCGYGLTPGASSDLAYATKLATHMVCSYGMYEEEVGIAVISKEELSHNEKAKALINQILSEQLQQAKTILNDNREALKRLVDAVMNSEKKYLTKKEIQDAYNG